MEYKNFFSVIMEKVGFPEESQIVLKKVEKSLISDPLKKEQFQNFIQKYLKEKDRESGLFDELKEFSFYCRVHPYEANMVLLLYCSQELLKRYLESGYTEQMFWDTVLDFKYKLMECKEVKGIWGTFVPKWYKGFFNLTCFALGRFQYEFREFPEKIYTAGGHTIRKGDKVLNFHIPSSGPLKSELRIDSYKKAYDFYKRDFKEGIVPFTCHSWLLYGDHKKFLPKDSNILSFMEDFDILYSTHEDSFADIWRIFGNVDGKKFSELPRKTSLQRAYADRLILGGKTGYGFGIFLFDGEKRLEFPVKV